MIFVVDKKAEHLPSGANTKCKQRQWFRRECFPKEIVKPLLVIGSFHVEETYTDGMRIRTSAILHPI